jgi:hypothetical protein
MNLRARPNLNQQACQAKEKHTIIWHTCGPLGQGPHLNQPQLYISREFDDLGRCMDSYGEGES